MASASPALTPKLIDALYVEALVLADEARTYFDETSLAERAALAPAVRVHFSCEAIKVTSRLMHVISWLLSARASSADIHQPIAAVPSTPASSLSLFPEAAGALIVASERLYERVSRLQAEAEPDALSPAHHLLARLDAAF